MTADAARVAEVFVKRKNGTTYDYSSGYRISSWLILTVAHQFTEDDLDCIVLLGGLDKKRPARRVWWGLGPDGAGPDLALLDLSSFAEDNADLDPVPLVGFGNLPKGMVSVPFVGVGFPRFQQRSDAKAHGLRRRESKQVNGLFLLGSNLKSGLLDLFFTNAQPEANDSEGLDPWLGGSGTALFTEGLLVGVQSQRLPFAGTASGEGIRITQALQEREFVRLLQKHGVETQAVQVDPTASRTASSVRHPVVEGALALGGELGLLLGPRNKRVVGAAERSGDTDRTAVEAAAKSYGRHLEDERERRGAALIAELVATMARQAGDGRATAAVLAAALIDEADRRIALGASPHALIGQAKDAGQRVRAEISRLSRECRSIDDVLAVVLGASADQALAEAVAEAVEQTGPDGVLLCEPGVSRGVETKRVPGLRLPAGYASPLAVTDEYRSEVRLDNPYVLLLGSTMADGSPERLLEWIEAEKRQVLILCAEHDPELLRMLSLMRRKPVPPVVRIGGANPADQVRKLLRDLGKITGGHIIASDRGMRPETAGRTSLGGAKHVTVTEHETVLVGGQGNHEMRRRWVDKLSRERAAAGPEEGAALDERLNMLNSEAIILRIGGGSSRDVAERVHAARSATRAAQTALQSGVVPGGGLAMLLCRNVLANELDKPGVAAMHAALSAPLRRLVGSVGLTEAEMEKLEAVPESQIEPHHFAVGRYPDAGHPIADSGKILALAIEEALSTLSKVLRTSGSSHA